MRTPVRNKFTVFYKTYLGETYIIDEYGNNTGSPVPEYSELKSAVLSVSPNKGSSEAQAFGTVEDYDRTMSTTDLDCEINEDSVLWLDGSDTDGAYNYIVKRRSLWKNSIAFAVKEVDVSHG